MSDFKCQAGDGLSFGAGAVLEVCVGVWVCVCVCVHVCGVCVGVCVYVWVCVCMCGGVGVCMGVVSYTYLVCIMHRVLQHGLLISPNLPLSPVDHPQLFRLVVRSAWGNRGVGPLLLPGEV